MKLTPEIRNRIYLFLFFTKGQGSQPITLDGKRKNESKDPYAKTFAQGSKNRVAILAANKQVSTTHIRNLSTSLTQCRSAQRLLRSSTLVLFASTPLLPS